MTTFKTLRNNFMSHAVEIGMLELKSNPESLNVVEKMIDDIRNKYNVSEDAYGNMLVALTEAVTNAIYHGNKSNPQKKVNLSCRKEDNLFSFVVTDEGGGFDY